MSREIVVDSPPGIASASLPERSSGFLTAMTDDVVPYPRCSSARQKASQCSLTFPWRARMPILTSTGLQHLIFLQQVDIETRHRIPNAPADLCQHLGVVEVVDRLDDR